MLRKILKENSLQTGEFPVLNLIQRKTPREKNAFSKQITQCGGRTEHMSSSSYFKILLTRKVCLLLLL